MKQTAKQRNQIKIQSKRNVELWIYSFADMYMILSVFFIALSVLYAAKIKNDHKSSAEQITAGKGPATVSTQLELSFSNASADLLPEVEEELKLLLPALKSLNKGFIEVEGYADSVPLRKPSSFSSNLDLSTRRAVRVSEWLVKQGVSSRRIRIFSYGDGHQFSTDGAVKSNRRVLIKVSTPQGSPS